MSLKAVLRVLRENDIHVVKSTVWHWRWKLPPSQKPPLHLSLDGARVCVTADRERLIRWVRRMEKQGLFDQSRKIRATMLRRRAIENPPARKTETGVRTP